jgi:hypothetical protein
MYTYVKDTEIGMHVCGVTCASTRAEEDNPQDESVAEN